MLNIKIRLGPSNDNVDDNDIVDNEKDDEDDDNVRGQWRAGGMLSAVASPLDHFTQLPSS